MARQTWRRNLDAGGYCGYVVQAVFSPGQSMGLRSWTAIHWTSLVISLFSGVVWLNIVDLWSSATALANGSGYEANGLVTSLASSLGLRVIGGIGVIKVVSVVGTLAVAVMALRARKRSLREKALSVMVFLDVVLAAVSINNLYVLGLV